MSNDERAWFATEWDVVLAASGYDWWCPICEWENRVMAVPRFDQALNGNFVTCDRCGTRSRVMDWEHCYD